jgi:hypothetical protein
LHTGKVTVYKSGNFTGGGMSIEHIIKLAQDYSAHKKLTLATVSTYAANDGKLFKRFEEGAGCTIKRADTLIGWFSENWPDNELDWPHDIPRPTSRKDAA